MQGHRNGGPPSQLPDPDSLEYHVQKVVLLELVVDPPRAGARLSTLIRKLDIPAFSVEPAIAALEAIGLAARDEDTVRATPPARHFEYLWPVMP
jgi:hypothetical protein